jgi:hypothetical protein
MCQWLIRVYETADSEPLLSYYPAECNPLHVCLERVQAAYPEPHIITLKLEEGEIS